METQLDATRFRGEQRGMTIFKNMRLGLLHVAVGVTFVVINGMLNRVMIHDLGILSTIVALLVVLPYFLSPLQVVVGQYSDNHPLWGYRRTPYIAAGLLLSVGGTALAPHAALLLATDFWMGILLGMLAFGAWGIGYNLAVVAYLSLASDLSTEAQRARTIAIMWFMMIVSLIVTAIIVGQAMETYDHAQMVRVINWACLAALAIGFLGLIGLEPRHVDTQHGPRVRSGEALRVVTGNPQAKVFFVYLFLLLVAILGQDILLEPYGAYAFGMSVRETTQLTALWGGMTLISLLLYGLLLSRWMSKKAGAALGGSLALFGLLMIAASGGLNMPTLFLPGIALLGFYLVTADRWERLVACLIGFVLARMALVQFLKPERDNTSSPKTQKNADPRSHTNPNPRNPCPIFRKAPDQSWKSPPTTSFFGNGDRCA